MPKNEDTRSKILAAALEEFAAKGLAGTRVDEIARLAGVNKAMIYYHFDSKEALFDALFQSELEQLRAELAAVLAGRDINSTEDTVAAVRLTLDYVEGKKKFLGVLISSAVLQESFQAHLFRLAELTGFAGQEAALASGRLGSPASRREVVLYELFTGLLPLAFFILTRQALAAAYGWGQEDLTNHFIASWLRQHGGY